MPIQLPEALGKALICIPWQCVMLSCPKGLPSVSAGGLSQSSACMFLCFHIGTGAAGKMPGCSSAPKDFEDKEVSGAHNSLCWFI